MCRLSSFRHGDVSRIGDGTAQHGDGADRLDLACSSRARCARRLIAEPFGELETMSEDDKIIQRGPFKGKKIVFASTEVLDLFQTLAEEFMEAIFQMEPGTYLISDESCLRDFEGVDDMNLRDIEAKIRATFGIAISNVQSAKIVDVLSQIHQERYAS